MNVERVVNTWTVQVQPIAVEGSHHIKCVRINVSDDYEIRSAVYPPGKRRQGDSVHMHVHEVVRPGFCRLMQECKNLVAGDVDEETIVQTLGTETDAAV